MARKLGLFLTLLLLAYGLIRTGVAAAMVAHMIGWVSHAELASAAKDVFAFIEARNDRQLIEITPFGFFVFLLVMGSALIVGSVGILLRKAWGFSFYGLFLLLHGSLFVNFQEINPKLYLLAGQVFVLFVLLYLRPPNNPARSTIFSD